MIRLLIVLSLVLVVGVGVSNAADIVIVNLDGSGEGFNDPTPVPPVGGNPGTTIGQQRLNVFQKAAEIWGWILPSAVQIRVEARFNPQSCDAQTGVLGSAGPIEVFENFSGAPVSNTWYHVALANRLAGVDLAVSNDISATFNSSIDNNNNCLANTNWYYGLDGNEGSDIELLPVVLHELGHGLGFSTLVSSSSGSEFFGTQDIYETFIRDNSLGMTWDQMTNAQRAASAINTGNVVWNGAEVTAAAPQFLSGVPTMVVNTQSPPLPSTIPIGTATFGPNLTETGVTGDVVLIEDGVVPINDGCEPLVNGSQLVGKIALFDRGACTFVSKALAAQAEGAIAVLIANNVPDPVPITMGGADSTVVIPVLSITQADGVAIKAVLSLGLNITLRLDPNDLAGTDTSGRVKLYTPNPVELGSSVSHWDISTLPNLLMEPAISNNLNDDVDLTIAHFKDIGWLEILTGIEDELPRYANLSLLSNYPNPFNPSTTIRYNVGNTQAVRLSIYDVQGRLVRTLFERVETAGIHNEKWDGRDDAGENVSSGMYFARLRGENQTATRKIVLLK